jgi:hypothetical protein
MHFDHDINVLINKLIALESPYFVLGALKSIITKYTSDPEKQEVLAILNKTFQDINEQRKKEDESC